ncbi:MAG: glycosyltransferase [Clostridia bacterium]|nr:glycosyltransferase [Clostridia bacterium]
MKIVQVIPQFSVGGAEIMCETLTYALIALGHDVIVVSLYDYHSVITERLEAAGVDVRYLGKKRGIDLSVLRRLCKLLRKARPDAVHSHLYASEYAVPAAFMAGVRHRVHTLHSIAQKENGRAGRLLNRIFFHCFHTIPVALSELVRETVVEEYHLKPKKIPVILNGVDLTKCKEKTDYARHGTFTVLHIGRFVKTKNQLGLLRAFSRFHAACPESELHLIGEGELKAAAEAYVAENGMADCVRFLGLQGNVHEFLHKADLFVLPSMYEGVPMTLIEAMGTGLPIVASAVGGIPNMLDEECATLVPCEEQAIADAMTSYYQSEQLCRTHGKAAKSRSSQFSDLKMAANYVEVYRT